jgi:predicted kinase
MNSDSVTNRAVLALVGGLPGAGKSTISHEILASRPGVFLCPDQYMADSGIDLKDSESRGAVNAQLVEQAWSLLDQGENVVLELGLWKKKEHSALRVAARNIGVSVELHFMNPPIHELQSRLKQRNKIAGGAIGHVSKKELNAWAAEVEHPKQKELKKFDNFQN